MCLPADFATNHYLARLFPISLQWFQGIKFHTRVHPTRNRVSWNSLVGLQGDLHLLLHGVLPISTRRLSSKPVVSNFYRAQTSLSRAHSHLKIALSK
jgi:hypothetical protein